MGYSIAELCVTLFVVTIFVNSALLIISAAHFYPDDTTATLPAMYQLFVDTIGRASGKLEIPSITRALEPTHHQTFPY